MKSTVAHALILAALTGSAVAAECGPDTLGTERTITLKREGALYGAHQHNALPLQKGEVVLTFDDGPVPEYTPMVLKALADQCAKATFFMIGERLTQYPQLARRVVGEGHSTGIHSYKHEHMAALSADEQLADLKKTQDIYRATFGTATPAYRFPFLEETPTLLAALKQADLTVASIDFGINDWLPDDTTEILVKRLTESLDKSGKGIILMHDANIPTAKALPALLKVLKDKGYKVVHLEWEK
ncbi:polysaccharide deacetylase family protein [Duganella sp. CT11-25]|uniref:polysaccharide deacetylase family protein n=1 Tax=unclassified Duganella TaxID=2636909 RepID=UPI0039B120FB